MVCLIACGAVLAAKRRALLQTTTTSYTVLSGEAEWEGNWELSELGADPSQAGGERVTIPFVGTDFALRVRRGAYRGYLFVSVDGEPADRLPRSERGAYLVLTSPDYTSQVVTIPVAAGLEDGPHEALVVAERAWDQWPLVGWSVSQTPDLTGYRWTLAGLGLMGLVCLSVWIGWGGPRIAGWRGGLGEGSPMYHAEDSASSIRFPALASRGASAWTLLAALVAAAVFYLSPWLPLTLVGGLALFVIVLLRLDLGLGLVAATVPFYLRPRPLFGRAFTMAELLTLLCALSWGVRQFGRWRAWRNARMTSPSRTQRTTPFRWGIVRPDQCPRRLASCIRRQASVFLQRVSALDVATAFFVLLAVFSPLVAEYRHVALRELRVVVLEPVLFYLMLRTSRLGKRAVWRIVDFWVLGCVLVAVIGLVQYVLGVNLITAEQGFRRLRSVYGSPNNAALYLGRVLPVLVAVALFGSPRDGVPLRAGKGGRGLRRRAAYGLAVAPVGLAVLLSFSKGALVLGVPLSLLALGVLVGGRWLWASLGALVVGAVAAIPILHTPRFATLLDTRSGTTFFRLQLWRSSWAMFRDHPCFGVGLDNFLYQYRGRYILPAAWQEPDLSHPHNMVLDYGCRMGLFGLAAGLWLQVAFWRLALPLRHLVSPQRRALALGLMGSMVSFLAHGLVDTSYFVIDLAFVFFLVLGVVQWLARSESDG